jgi:hypothetical protein
LGGARDADVVAAVRSVVGVQAQDGAAASLAVRARTEGASAEAVAAALASGALVRAWAMRGTLHLLAADDLPLALAIFAPLHLARGRRRLTELGLPPAEAERSTDETAAILAEHGPLDRHQLAARLRDRGVPVAAEGQAPIHVVRRAALAGVLCEVGVSGVYGPLEISLPDRNEALAELAARYAASHAPCDAEDFAAWSGLPVDDVRAAWSVPDPVPPGERGGVRLLPAFDEWLLGWASRDLVLAPEHARRVVPGGGIIRPVAISDGRVFGTWRVDRRRRRVELDPFVRRPPSIRAEVAALSEFLGEPLSVSLPS